MRAKVLRSFVSNQPRVRASAGKIIDLPDDVDWVRAGLVEVLPEEPRPEIDLEELNDPEIPKKYQNRLKKLVEDAALHTPEKAVTREKADGSQLTAHSKKQPTKTTTKPAAKKPAAKTSSSGKK